MPAAAELRAAHIVELAADAAVLPEADALGGHLPCYVNLHRGVDRYHVVVLGNYVRVVGIHETAGLALRVVVEEGVHAFAAHGEAEGGDAAVDIFPGVVHRAALHQVDHRLHEELRVDAKMALRLAAVAHGDAQSADAELDAGPVRDALGDEVGDPVVQLAGRGVRHHAELLGLVDGAGDILYVYHVVLAVDVGDVLIDLHDDVARGVAEGGVHGREAEAHHAVFVGGRGGHHDDVAGVDVGAVVVCAGELQHLRVYARAHLIDECALRRAEEKAVHVHMAVAGLCERAVEAAAEAHVDVDALEPVFLRSQLVEERIRQGRVHCGVNRVTGADVADGLMGRYELVGVLFSPVHGSLLAQPLCIM